jgi:hypothetical protein
MDCTSGFAGYNGAIAIMGNFAPGTGFRLAVIPVILLSVHGIRGSGRSLTWVNAGALAAGY